MNEATTTIEADTENGDTPDNLSNDKRFNDFLKVARGYGKATALGADALPKLALEITRESKNGVIDLEQNKKAIHEIYDAYWSMRKKAVHVQGKDGRNAQVSKLKQFHTLGGNTSFDGEALMNRAVEIYKDNIEGTKLKSVYAAYVDVARMANDRAPEDGEPTDEDILNAMLPKEKPEKTLADVIGHIKEQLADVVSGERKDGIACQDTEVTDAVESLQRWLAKMTLQSEMDALTAKLDAMGMGFKIEPKYPEMGSGPFLQLVHQAS